MDRQLTPPYYVDAALPASADTFYSRATSASSCYNYEVSPVSIASNGTHATTPDRSPQRQTGPTLLPKIRQQDMTTEPTANLLHANKAKANAHLAAFDSYGRRPPMPARIVTSPSYVNHLVGDVASAVSHDSPIHSSLSSPIDFHARRLSVAAAVSSHVRSNSIHIDPSAERQHSRNPSTNSAVDEQTLSRYGFPTYRQMPTTVTGRSTSPGATALSHLAPMARQVSPAARPASTAYGHLAPMSNSALNAGPSASQYQGHRVVSSQSATPTPTTVSCPAPVEVDLAGPTTTLLEYLTGPNPSPALIKRSVGVNHRPNYFWWDVRNLRHWSDFNIETITNTPGFLNLLQVPVSDRRLPLPPRTNPMPETDIALQEVVLAHHGAKLNAALAVTLGSSALGMKALPRATLPRPGREKADFISNVVSSYAPLTLDGEGRGRVVGLVKSYDKWNSGMRAESPVKQVEYLRGLAHLHHLMRAHGTRYGFLINEIELVCVRAGGPVKSHEPGAANVPVFGYLETATPIPMATSCAIGSDPTARLQMTVGLALWYLHLLAKDTPLPGQRGWKLDVGLPSALTRQNHTEKDAWIPKISLKEKREAKNTRGWIFPNEGLSKKERQKQRVVGGVEWVGWD